MSVVMVVMVVIIVPLSCSPIVVDLGLVRVALDRERAPAPGLRVRSVFSREQLHVSGLLVAHVVLVFVVGLCWSAGAGAVVVVMMVVMMMAVSLWLTTKEPFLLLCLLLHFLFFLLLLLSRLLSLGRMLLLVLLRSFSLSGSRLLAFLFILYTGFMT
ncbi:Proteolipid protein 2 [Labeo rohita]|uniref:Proteolipid protein 2 n=1 Tax=Labeo rohita TaxID=84645 RepID=A0ABQ8L2R3_LABRO|nr:Proteolipid protein 2 [Labeo rohita]